MEAWYSTVYNRKKELFTTLSFENLIVSGSTCVEVCYKKCREQGLLKQLILIFGVIDVQGRSLQCLLRTLESQEQEKICEERQRHCSTKHDFRTKTPSLSAKRTGFLRITIVCHLKTSTKQPRHMAILPNLPGLHMCQTLLEPFEKHSIHLPLLLPPASTACLSKKELK